MSTNNEVQTNPTAVVPDLSTGAPTTTRYMTLADEFIATFDQLAAKIPKFEIKPTSTVAFVNTHLAVPLQCLHTAVAAMELTPELQSLKRFNVAEARDTLQLIDAFGKVVDGGETFMSAVRFTVNLRRAELASAVLQYYSLTKRLGRAPDSADLATHAVNIGRDLGRKGRSKKAKANPPQPQPNQPGTPPSGGAPAPTGTTPTPPMK